MPANCMPGNLGGFDVMYESKTWKNRETEYPGRRRMTAVAGQADVFDVSREEGLVLEEGDAFDAATMNDMEQRVKNGFEDTCPYLYKASLSVDAWSGEGPYTQTAVLVPVDGGPTVAADSLFVSGVMCEQTEDKAENEALQDALTIINAGVAVLETNSVKVKIWEKPSRSLDVLWQIKKGGGQ